MLNTAVDSDDGNPMLRDRARKALSRWLRRIQDIVRSGITKGEIRNEIDPLATATVIISTLEGALMIGRLQHSRSALQHAREYLGNFLESLATASLETSDTNWVSRR